MQRQLLWVDDLTSSRARSRNATSWARKLLPAPESGLILLLLLPLRGMAWQASSESQKQTVDASRATETTAGAASRISESQLVGLPLNGRSYSQLATLQGEVSDPFAGSASRGGGSGGLTVAGARSTSNNFLMDGTNIMNTENQVPRSAAGVQLGSDAVLQVQVFSGNYGAELGRGTGGVLNSITRSGTQELHGTFFEYFRNSHLDARNFFDFGLEPAPFKRNQFGFTLTGPVRKGRTFFMGSMEVLRDRLTRTNISFFPDEPARQGILTDCAGNPVLPKPLEVNERVKAYLAPELYPLPNAGCVGGGIGRHAAPQFLPTDETFFTVRLDHQMKDRDSFFIRYTFDDATSNSPEDTFLFARRDVSRQQYLTLVETHVFSPSLLNSFRFGYTRPVTVSNGLSSIEIPSDLMFVPGAPQFGQIAVPGLSTFGPSMFTPSSDIMNTFQFANDLVLQRGAHELKFGLQVHRYRWDVVASWQRWGVWSFNSLESFLQGGPTGTNLQVALPGSDSTQAYRQTLLGFYIQDAIAVSPRLQLHLGLRYEYATLIHDKRGKTTFLADPFRDAAVRIGPYLESNPSGLQFSPRLGLTWSPRGSRNLVLRAGFGMYYDPILEYVVHARKTTIPFYKKAIRTNFDSSALFPDALAAAVGIPYQVQSMDYKNMAVPTVLRYDFALEQHLPGGWRVQASYLGARGNHLFRNYEANLFPLPITRQDGSLFFPPNTAPINPVFGAGIAFMTSDAQSFYNSFQISANKSLSRGLFLQASYTFSKSVDDSSATLSSSQYGYDRTHERGLSDFDIRHRLVFNHFFTPPLGRGQRWFSSGLLSYLFGGWRLGGILQFRAGTPFTPTVNMRNPGYLFAPTRPNLVPGRSNNPVRGGPDQYFDPTAFEPPPEPGTLGNLGRNTIIAPSVFSLDVSLQRDFLLGGKRRIQFRAEFFNLPNHPNFNRITGASAIVFTGAAGRPNSSAGKITNTNTTARQIQFALRFSF